LVLRSAPIIAIQMHVHEHPEPLKDDELLLHIGQGCTDCFTLLFHRYCRQVFCVSYRILRDRAETEDVLQEVFLSIYLQQERFDRTRGSVRTWILQFAYFKALLRRRYLSIRNFYKQEEASELREVRASRSADVFGMSPTEWARYVEAGTAALGEKQREVIELVHFEGYTLRETASLLGETLANTRNYYYRGLKILRSFLTENRPMRKANEDVVLERRDAYHFGS
jgi:RNA polymerase sigma-70 factor, ECF subfamily